MNIIRTKISLALESLVMEKHNVAFENIAYHLVKSKWPSLVPNCRQHDLGEDARTIVTECSDTIIRSIAFSISNTYSKVRSDATKIRNQRSDVQEYIFATPKEVSRRIQVEWEKRIKKEFGWKLIVIDKPSFLSFLERPKSRWILEQYFNISEEPQIEGILCPCCKDVLQINLKPRECKACSSSIFYGPLPSESHNYKWAGGFLLLIVSVMITFHTVPFPPGNGVLFQFLFWLFMFTIGSTIGESMCQKVHKGLIRMIDKRGEVLPINKSSKINDSHL